jgi:O-antigen ligase
MPPLVALVLWAVLLVALLRFDPAREKKVSPWLWVPVLWMFILATRLPSQWFGTGVEMSIQANEEGNALDRGIDLAFIIAGAIILRSRLFALRSFFERNLALIAYLAFALISVVWSDYSFVALKRWIRDSCNILMVLIVLSDAHAVDAVKVVYRRLNYLLIPLSILLVKYFPEIGKAYTSWSGSAMWVGPTTGKNLLGLVALLSTLFFLHDTLSRWPERKKRRGKQVILVNICFLAMSVWLLRLASSTTCLVICVLGSLVIVGGHTRIARRNPTLLKVLVPSSFLLYVLLAYGFDMNGQMAGAIGKDPTLTDRTLIWSYLLGLHTNPLFGTGYESFWVGDRLRRFWEESGQGNINEAHNGFLEVYLNLGLVGLALLAGVVISSYRKICRRLNSDPKAASLDLTFWVTMLFFSATEAGFRSGLMWIVFLLGAVVVPERIRNRVRGSENITLPISDEPLANLRLKATPDRNATWVQR